MREAVIADAIRTPVGQREGMLQGWRPDGSFHWHNLTPVSRQAASYSWRKDSNGPPSPRPWVAASPSGAH